MTMTMTKGRGRGRSRSRNLSGAGAGNFKNGRLRQPCRLVSLVRSDLNPSLVVLVLVSGWRKTRPTRPNSEKNRVVWLTFIPYIWKVYLLLLNGHKWKYCLKTNVSHTYIVECSENTQQKQDYWAFSYPKHKAMKVPGESSVQNKIPTYR